LTHAEEGKDSAAQQLSPNREQTNMHHKSPEQREAFNSGEESDSLLEEDDLETLRLLHSGKKLHATLQTNPLNDSPPVSPVPQHQQRRRLHKSSESVSGPIDHHRLPDLQSRCQSASELLAVAPEVIMSTLFEVSGNWKLLVKTIVYYGKDSMDSRMLRFNHRDDVIIMNSVFPALDRRPVPPAGDQFEENYETMDQMIEKRGAARVEYRVRFLQTVVDEVESVLLTVS
jgi:hypothetical protein